MAVYTVQTPHGVMTVEGPEGASEQEVIGQAQRLYASQQQAASPAPAAEQKPQPRFDNSNPLTMMDKAAALGDVGAAALQGGASQVVGGLSGLSRAATNYLGITDPKNGTAADYVEAGREAVGSWTPKSEAGKQLFEELGGLGEKARPVLQAIDDAYAGDFGQENGGFVNPVLSAAAKTIVEGIPEVVLGKGMNLGKRAVNTAKSAGSMSTAMRRAKADAEAMGLKLSNDELRASILNKADTLAPNYLKGESLDDLQDALKIEQELRKNGVDDAFEVARAKVAYAKVKPLQDTAKDVYAWTRKDGVDIKNSPLFRERLKDIRLLDRVIPSTGDKAPVVSAKPRLPAKTTTRGIMGEEVEVPTASVTDAATAQKPTRFSQQRLSEIETVRRRIVNNINDVGPKTAQGRALIRLKEELDTQLGHQFDEQMISGDKTAIAAWRKARELNTNFEKDFFSDNTIRRFIAKDMDPEQLYRWLIGSSAVAGSKSAARTLAQMKRIVGADNKGIDAVRKAMLRDVLAPLRDDVPNWNAVTKNIDRLLVENYSLAKEAGIDMKELQTLRKATHAARFVKEVPDWDRGIVSRIAARIVWGNKLAKNAAVLRLIHKGVDMMIGTGILTDKEILRHLAEVDYKRPIVDYKRPGAAQVLLGAAPSAFAEDIREEE